MNAAQPPVTIRRTPEPVSVTERASLRMTLNIVIGVLVLLNGYLAYGRYAARVEDDNARAAEALAVKAKPIQLNVLNGCGQQGIAARCTDFLRTRGFDVVEMKNFPVTGIPKTIIVDRIGNPASAAVVARAIGLDTSQIIQQVNPNLFVEVTVILGNDYATLVPFSQ